MALRRSGVRLPLSPPFISLQDSRVFEIYGCLENPLQVQKVILQHFHHKFCLRPNSTAAAEQIASILDDVSVIRSLAG